MGLFDREYVSDQLKSAGTFAYYRLMRKGYPLRMDIQEFFAQYQPHLQKNNIRIDAKKLLQILFHHNNVPEHEYRFGATSVMLRSGQHQNIIQLKQFEEPIISINVDIVMKKLVARSKWTLLIAAAKLYLRCEIFLNVSSQYLLLLIFCSTCGPFYIFSCSIYSQENFNTYYN